MRLRLAYVTGICWLIFFLMSLASNVVLLILQETRFHSDSGDTGKPMEVQKSPEA